VKAVEWHPLSDVHIGVLTATSWELLNLAEFPSRDAEQTIPLGGEYLSFTFCRFGSIWAHLSVFFLTWEGEIRYRTPILPRIALLPKLVWAQLRANRTEEFAEEVVGKDADPSGLVDWLRATVWSSSVESETVDESASADFAAGFSRQQWIH
jgi:hypothetical protein